MIDTKTYQVQRLGGKKLLAEHEAPLVDRAIDAVTQQIADYADKHGFDLQGEAWITIEVHAEQRAITREARPDPDQPLVLREDVWYFTVPVYTGDANE